MEEEAGFCGAGCGCGEGKRRRRCSDRLKPSLQRKAATARMTIKIEAVRADRALRGDLGSGEEWMCLVMAVCKGGSRSGD